MTIGARVVKTGLAVAVALWVGALIGLDAPLIAAIAAIFTVQPSIYRSWTQIIDQVQSNVLGAAIAIGAAFLIGNTPLAVGLVCIGVILLCIRLKTEATIELTLVTIVIIMEAQSGDHGIFLALDRLYAILTGIGSAFLVNVVVAPPRHQDRFVRNVQEAQAQMSRLLRTAVSNELKENVFREEHRALRGKLRKLGDYYDLFAEERSWHPKPRVSHAKLLVVYKAMLNTLEQGEALIGAVEGQYFAVTSDKQWNRMVDEYIDALCGYNEQLLWKWDGVMKVGSSASLPREITSKQLTDLVIKQTEEDGNTRARLLVLTSAIFLYEDNLRRLDKRMEQFLNRTSEADKIEGSYK